VKVNSFICLSHVFFTTLSLELNRNGSKDETRERVGFAVSFYCVFAVEDLELV